MNAPKQIRKPANWQDFETLCKKLWGEVWCCADSIKRNGRQGQNQHGVDVYAIPKGESAYYGIQCKGKDDYTKNQLSTKEIDTEIEKATAFMPPLKRFIFATTANKDVKIEEYIREKNIENIQKGLFEVDIFSWEDIVDLLEDYRVTYQWYVNSHAYNDTTDVEVNFNQKQEVEIHPEYFKKTTVYKYESQQLTEEQKQIQQLWKNLPNISGELYPPHKIDYTWCKFKVYIKNTGSTTIENYKLKLVFDSETTMGIHDCFFLENNRYVDNATKAQINGQRHAEREVYASSEFANVIEIISKDKILVSKDCRTFTIKIKPKENVEEIKVDWQLLANNYDKKGLLIIKVTPIFEKIEEIITVYDDSEIQKPTTVILPKIVELQR